MRLVDSQRLRNLTFAATAVSLICCVWTLNAFAEDEASEVEQATSQAMPQVAVRVDVRVQYALTHPGDPNQGRLLFQDQERTRCMVCHQLGRYGGNVGPALNGIGGKFDRPHLIESLLEPSREIVEGYNVTNLALTDGRGKIRHSLGSAQIGGDGDALAQLRQLCSGGTQLVFLARGNIGFHAVGHKAAGDHGADSP